MLFFFFFLTLIGKRYILIHLTAFILSCSFLFHVNKNYTLTIGPQYFLEYHLDESESVEDLLYCYSPVLNSVVLLYSVYTSDV